MPPVISIENISKSYRLGVVGRGTLGEDLQSWWHRVRGLPDPNAPIGHEHAAIEGHTLWALQDVSLEVQQGEVLGIIGRNGAGKSTLLKILSRVTAPTSGRIRIKGRVASLLEVGTGFHPELTGRENIFLNGAILGMTKAEVTSKFDEIVAFSEIEQFIDTPVKRYSSGMYVRLAFAVAAHLDPEILVVDEVLAVGDVDFQKKCLGKMKDVSHQGRTVLIVSHNMPTIANLCHKAVLLNHGTIDYEGTAKEVVTRYLSARQTVEGQRIWADPTIAPGNDLARLNAVRMVQGPSGTATADIDIGKECQLQIDYWCMKDGANLYAGFWLRDGHKVDILWGGNTTEVNLTPDGWFGKPHPHGIYRAVCTFPADFFNNISYSITPIVGKAPSQTIVLEEDALCFRGHDTGTMRKEYYGEWLGVVRAKFAWSVKPLDACV
jgi:lipopolysaccharide transport system ATP-binding protein